ncbi:papain like cysteine protease AvrRpt2 [Paraburkholderia unamae]|uniref:cysteine peptidase family C39 domain-containing protein n=1 Tax=Paraburkholderia unamae TaxID=219649 RepID=UPI000DC58DBA|nr:papain-like cysteine protease family protein [Paraburkholderia unamae]RAR57605.1 papain like cysteine protease AvrRpt2 [Paraburkholderia unamae]
MSELTDTDDDGNSQYIWLQERADTCGPACIYMIERIVQQACPAGGEVRIRQICELLPDGYQEGKGTASFGALASAMQRVGFGATATFIKNFKEFALLADFPFITRIGWPNNAGHFVVCAARTRGGSLVCLDPWYGLSEPKLNSLPSYQVINDVRAAVCLVHPAGGVFSGHTVLLRG